jgi:DNA-binding NarL/FixJ family response regulator
MPKKIFIIDDSKIVRELVRRYLESRLEYIVCSEAADGLDAIDHAREVDPDLIILDISMPRLNGLDAAFILHEMLPRVPIILYTLHKDIVSPKRSQAAGIRAVVSKSDPIDVLVGEVANCASVARTPNAAANASVFF